MPTQNEVNNMVDKHVLAPATQLIAGMVDMTSHSEYMITVFDIWRKPDYSSPASDFGIEVEQRPDGFYYIAELAGSCYEGAYLTEQAAAEHHGIEPYYTEVHEHWIVSDWLANQLEQRGELIERDFYGLNIWGRCATGQAIHLDGVMAEIYTEVGKSLGL